MRTLNSSTYQAFQQRVLLRGQKRPRRAGSRDLKLILEVMREIPYYGYRKISRELREEHITFLGRLAIDLLEKPEPLHVHVSILGSADQLAVEIIQRSEQRDCTVTMVIMRSCSNVADAERLTLGLLVATEHQRVFPAGEETLLPLSR